MKKLITALLLSVLLLASTPSMAQQTQDFNSAASGAQQRLEKSIAELNGVRAQASEEVIPLSRELRELESELNEVRLEFQNTTRLLDSRTLDLSNLRSEIKSRKDESSYLSNLFSEYIRNFESRLHIIELQRYEAALEAAKLAPENSNLTDEQVYQEQAKLLSVSLDRVDEVLGGSAFEGTAVDTSGRVQNGTFLMFGPTALFLANDGSVVGTAEQRLGSLEPAVIPFNSPEDTAAATQIVKERSGAFPFDPTQGNAHKIEETEETFSEHIAKGGPVMYPIFGLAGISILVALYKWLSFTAVRRPSKKALRRFYDNVTKGTKEDIQYSLKRIKTNQPQNPVNYAKGAGVGFVFGLIMSFVVDFRIATELAPWLVEFAANVGQIGFIAVFTIAGALIHFFVRFVLGYSPTGIMLEAGVNHLEYPTTLIEEVMFEKILETRLRLESMLPLIAISAAAAPLLGLLGTVTGIINTFKLITVFGSGDVKTLSGGISEALITTEFGLISAIPALLLHSFLSRKAKAIINQMEQSGVGLMNELGKVPMNNLGAPAVPSNLGNDLTSVDNIQRLSKEFGVSKLTDEKMKSASKTEVSKTKEEVSDEDHEKIKVGTSSSNND